MADNNGRTVFHYVAFKDHYKLVEELIDADISVAYLRDKEHERTALHVAAEKGNVRVLKELLDHIPDSLEIIDAGGQNILHLAVREERYDAIDLILARAGKASNKLWIQRDKKGNTPLHLVAKNGVIVDTIMDEFRPSTVDWEVLNHKNLTPLELLCTKRDGTFYHWGHENIRKMLINANVKQHLHLWPTLKAPDGKTDMEKGITFIRDEEWTREFQSLGEVINTHIIVTALIATVALTAGFTVPGGFNGNHGPEQGSAILLRKTAFQTFMVTDAIALLFSMSSLFLYFIAQYCPDVFTLQDLVSNCVLYNLLSLIAMMVAFISGTYAVLAHSSALATSVCVILCFFYPLVYCVFKNVLTKSSYFKKL